VYLGFNRLVVRGVLHMLQLYLFLSIVCMILNCNIHPPPLTKKKKEDTIFSSQLRPVS
jgi:hypothetical protein